MEYLFYKQNTTWRGECQVVRYIEERGCCFGFFSLIISMPDTIVITFIGYMDSFYG